MSAPVAHHSNDIEALSATGGGGGGGGTATTTATTGEPNTNRRQAEQAPAEQKKNDNNNITLSHWSSKKQIMCVVIVSFLAIALTLGLCLGLQLNQEKDDCKDQQETSYSLTFQTNTAVTPEEIPITSTTNTNSNSSMYLSGTDSITWTRALFGGAQNTLLSSFGQAGWFDRVIRIRNVNPTSMTLKVYHHNEMKLTDLMSTIFAPEEITNLQCDPPFVAVDLYTVLIGIGGGSSTRSEEFDLGVCTVSRVLDDDNESNMLVPRDIQLVFTGIVSVDRVEQN